MRPVNELTLDAQGFDGGSSLTILGRKLLHRLAVLFELASRVNHEGGGLLGLLHDVGHLLYLRADRLEPGHSPVEVRDARSNRLELLGRANRLVPDVLDRSRDLREPAAAPVQPLEQGIELVTLVTSSGHNRVQFVGALLRLGAEGQLLEHVRLLVGSDARRGMRNGLFDEDDRDRRCGRGAKQMPNDRRPDHATVLDTRKASLRE